MTTVRQIQANRRNARKSSGPRTDAGKAIVRLNATRHGLRASTVLVPGLESPADWVRFRAGVVDSLKPVGLLAETLAERAAGLLWRLRRVERFETATVLADQAELEIPARPRTGEAVLDFDDEEGMSDSELLVERERSVAEAQDRLAKFTAAGKLAAQLRDLADDAPIDPTVAMAFVTVCAEQAEAAGASDDVPDSEDTDGLLEAAGMPTADGASAGGWTVAAIRRVVVLFANALTKKKSADWLVKEVAEASAEWVEDAKSTIETDEPEAISLRRRVTLRNAVARARRTCVGEGNAAHIARYEGHLQRQLKHTLDELERLQGTVVTA